MKVRARSILQYIERFGASRTSDIYMQSTGGPPSQAEIDDLVESGHLERFHSSDQSRAARSRDAGGIYWAITEKGRNDAR